MPKDFNDFAICYDPMTDVLYVGGVRITPLNNMKQKLYQDIASKANAMRHCEKTGNTEWQDKHEQAILELVKEHLPSGSGFDSGTKIDLDACTDTKLVFTTAFHHMNDNGMYDGWTEHKVVITPSFSGFDMKITGRDRNGIKEVIADYFHNDLSKMIEE